MRRKSTHSNSPAKSPESNLRARQTYSCGTSPVQGTHCESTTELRQGNNGAPRTMEGSASVSSLSTISQVSISDDRQARARKHLFVAENSGSSQNSLVILVGDDHDDDDSLSISSVESPARFSKPFIKTKSFPKKAGRFSSPAMFWPRAGEKVALDSLPAKQGQQSSAKVGAPMAALPLFISTRQLVHMTLSVLFALWIFVSGFAVFQRNIFGGDAPRLVLPDQHHSHQRVRVAMSRLDMPEQDIQTQPQHDPSTGISSQSAPLSISSSLALPPNKVSVIIMNHNRPRMVQESSLMRTLISHPNIDEIILLHSNPKTAFVYDHPKVVNLDASQQNDEMGLSLRFFFCQFASNDWVLHVDDDMEPTLSALSALFSEFSKNTHRIVGKWGRRLDPSSPYNDYLSVNVAGTSEVVLTKIMVAERQLCGEFMRHSHLIWEDVVLGNSEGPLWNGEDIFMSLVSNHVYGNDQTKWVNYAMPWLDVGNAPKDYKNSKFDISAGRQGFRVWDWQWWQSFLRRNRHFSYRGMFWKTARKRLAEVVPSNETTPHI